MTHNPPIPRCLDAELERQALGLLLIGDAPPPWFGEQHVPSGWHPVLLRAIVALRKRNPEQLLPRTARLLVRKGLLYRRETHNSDRHASHLLSSVDLSEMVAEALHAQTMGWPLPWDELRELADRRGLLEKIERVAIRLRHGDLTAEEARKELVA